MKTLRIPSVAFIAIFLAFTAFAYVPRAQAFGTAVAVSAVSPYHIDTLSVQNRNDFVLEPAKQEVFLNPGQSSTSTTLYVTDRVEGTTTFSISVQDIKGSSNPNAPVVILQPGDVTPDSAQNFISVPAKKFTLTFGQRARIPVTIAIPKNASPGGYYAAILISNEPTVAAEAANAGAAGTTRVISRIGTLFFIRVNGPANPSGSLQGFRINAPSNQLIYNSGPFTFEVLFNNTGDLYLTPYGIITIKNMFGETIATIPVNAYYSLPQSLRYRDVTWNGQALFGRYTATLTLNRGYNNLTDTQTIAFWVIPWKFLAIAFIILFIIVLVAILFLRRFEIRKKQ